jgi:hypothetical protein
MSGTVAENRVKDGKFAVVIPDQADREPHMNSIKNSAPLCAATAFRHRYESAFPRRDAPEALTEFGPSS